MFAKYLLSCGVAAAVISCAFPSAAQEIHFNIPSQPVASAVSMFGRQSGIQIVAPAAGLDGIMSRPVIGRMDAREGLRSLIEGSRLQIASDTGDRIVLTLRRETPDTSVTLDEIVVTGARLQNRKAVAERRGNLQVSDSVTSDDVGRLPDFNIGEALLRIPGVSAQNDQGEARFVTIRAMNANYNYTLIDGVSVAVPDRNGRRVFMDVMPASLADRIDVFKTFTPDLEGGAVGGIIDVRTASAFDRPRHSLELSSEIGYYENDEDFEGVGPSGTLDFSYSTTFGDADQLGVVLFANYYKRDSYGPHAEYGVTRYFYTPEGADAGQPGVNTGGYPGTGLGVPPERRWFYYHNDRTRFGGGGKIEYEASPSDYLFLRGFWNIATDDEARQTDLLNHQGGGVFINQTAMGGDLIGARNVAVSNTLGQFDFERSVWALTGGGDHAPAGGKLSWRLNYSGSHFHNPENWSEWRQGSTAGDFRVERTGDHFVFTPLNPAAFFDYSAYAPVQRRFDDRELDEGIYEAKADYGRDLVGNWGFEVGAGVRRIDRDFDERPYRYTAAAGNTYNLLAADVLRPDLCLRAPGAGEGQCMTVVDPARSIANFEAHLAGNPEQWVLDPMATNNNNLDYALQETVWHGYGLLRYVGDRWRAVAGARYEDTRMKAKGRRQRSGVWSDVETEGAYEDILPSVNVSFDALDNVKLRAAYSQSLGRVPFNALAPVGESLVVDGTTVTLRRSNPDLLPRRAENFDLATDWYFSGGRGLLSASLFYKKIENEFLTTTSIEMIEVDGVEVEATVSQPTNAGAPVDVYGLELNLVRELDSFLPEPLHGFTLSANLTLLDTNLKQQMTNGSEVELKTLVGQADTTYNVALSYDRRQVSARLAYNYTSERLAASNNVSAYRNRYDGEEDSLDFKLRYALTENWAALFTASNITGSGRTMWMGWDQEMPIIDADFGSSYFVGFSFKL